MIGIAFFTRILVGGHAILQLSDQSRSEHSPSLISNCALSLVGMANAGHPRSRVEAMREASRLAVIGVGGVLGALSRAGVSQIFGQDRLELGDQSANFPWATLAINLSGAFLIGIAAVALITDNSSYRKPFLVTGVLGGFTTFSALALEAVDLFDQGLWVTALVYLIVTVGAGLLAVNIGVRAPRRIVRT